MIEKYPDLYKDEIKKAYLKIEALEQVSLKIDKIKIKRFPLIKENSWFNKEPSKELYELNGELRRYSVQKAKFLLELLEILAEFSQKYQWNSSIRKLIWNKFLEVEYWTDNKYWKYIYICIFFWGKRIVCYHIRNFLFDKKNTLNFWNYLIDFLNSSSFSKRTDYK